MALLRSPRDGKKPTASAVGLVFGEAEEVVGGAFEDLAEGFDIFIADGFRFVVGRFQHFYDICLVRAFEATGNKNNQ